MIMNISPMLTSVLTDANAIPKIRNTRSRKKGIRCKILMGLYNVFYFLNFFNSEMVSEGFSDLKTKFPATSASAPADTSA